MGDRGFWVFVFIFFFVSMMLYDDQWMDGWMNDTILKASRCDKSSHQNATDDGSNGSYNYIAIRMIYCMFGHAENDSKINKTNHHDNADYEHRCFFF